MTIAEGPRLEAARTLVERFAAEGRPSVPLMSSPATTASERDRQRSPVGWPVDRATLVAQLRARLAGTDAPDQKGTSHCGPAAFLSCLLEDRPDLYAAYAVAMWQRGAYAFRSGRTTMEVGSGAGVRGALAKARAADPARRFISDLDWMTMAPLSASTRPFVARIFGSPEPDDQAGSVSYPRVVKGWYAAVGSALIADTMGLGLMKTATPATIRLLRHWPDCWIVLQIDSSLLSGGGTNTFTNRHWVVVDPHRRPLVRVGKGGVVVPLSEVPGAVPAGAPASPRDEWEVSLRFVTWGKEGTPLHDPRLGSLAGRIYGGFAFSRFR